MKMKFTGKEYRGVDGTLTVHAFNGQVVEVSPRKAAQLLADFGHEWKAVDNPGVPLFNAPGETAGNEDKPDLGKAPQADPAAGKPKAAAKRKVVVRRK